MLATGHIPAPTLNMHNAATVVGCDVRRHEARENDGAQNGSACANGNAEEAFGMDSVKEPGINCIFDAGHANKKERLAEHCADLKLETRGNIVPLLEESPVSAKDMSLHCHYIFTLSPRHP